VFVLRTSSTPVATWFWQTEGISAERVILAVQPSEFILSEFQSLSRRIFISSHSLPPLWSPNRSFIFTASEGTLHAPDHVEKASPLLPSSQDQGFIIVFARGDHPQPRRQRAHR
jgi:hypothetical protein